MTENNEKTNIIKIINDTKDGLNTLVYKLIIRAIYYGFKIASNLVLVVIIIVFFILPILKLFLLGSEVISELFLMLLFGVATITLHNDNSKLIITNLEEIIDKDKETE